MTTIDILDYDQEPRPVPAKQYGPLAVHRHSGFVGASVKPDLWTITHVKSGCAVVLACDSLATANEIAKAMQDWPEWDRVRTPGSKKALSEIAPKRAGVLAKFHCDELEVYSMNGRERHERHNAS